MTELVDTHCHIHFPDYELDPEETMAAATKEGVTKLICVGCTLTDSKLGVEFAKGHENVWSTVGLHPHEAKDYVNDEELLRQFRNLASQPKVVAIGEAGLDYYYGHSPKTDQKKLLRFQLSLAKEHGLPLVFHVRDEKAANGKAFEDFLAILGDFEGIRGVVHSFTAPKAILDKLLSQGLYIGLNGIMTFTVDKGQTEMAKQVPLSKLLLETDAPFLTPVPFRGSICQPKHVRVTAEFISRLRGEDLDELAAATTHNAETLFNLK